MTEPEFSEVAAAVRQAALVASDYQLDKMIAVSAALARVAVAHGRDAEARMFADQAEVADGIRMDRLHVTEQVEQALYPTVDLGLIDDEPNGSD